MGKNKSSSAALNKRWFANMTGWGLSFQVGSGEPQKGKRSIAVPVDQKFDATLVAIAPTHNVLYTFNPVAQIAAGVSGSERTGTGIKLKGISFRFTFTSALTAPVNLRVMVVASTLQFTGGNFVSGLTPADLFYNTVGVETVYLHVDSRKAKVLCDSVYTVAPTVANTYGLTFQALDCMLDLPFAFRADTVYGASANLYVVVTAINPNSGGQSVVGQLLGEVVMCWAD